MDEEDILEQSDLSVNSIDSTPEFLSLRNDTDMIVPGRHWTDQSYPAWTCSSISVKYISLAIMKAQKVLGFQFDASVNVFELLMSQLDSRASRSTPELALRSLHADYIAAPHANYRKWYFASQMDITDISRTCEDYADCTLDDAQFIWQARVKGMSNDECLTDIIIYLLCWCEANQIRYMPECLAFIYKCTRDFYSSVIENDLRITCPENYYLDSVITPLYDCYVNFNFEKTEKGYIRRENDHRHTIGYDDMNQLFWYHEGIERLIVAEVRLLSLDTHERFLKLGKVEWETAFTKTYRETRTWLHAITNFSRILILHASSFWFYTSFNAPTLYTKDYNYRLDQSPLPHIQLTTVALGGAIGPLITILALLGELWFVPRSFPGAIPVLPRLLITFVLLGFIVAPSVYIYTMTSWNGPEMAATILSGVQFTFSILVTLYFSVQPLANLFGANYQDSERQFLANQYFTKDFRSLSKYDTLLSWFMSTLILLAKLTESYFFLTLSVKDPIYELSILKLKENCLGDIWLGSLLCAVFPKLILATVILLETILFFLDTYLWYVIVNVTISIVLSFYLGASIWTPWRNVYTRLPKRISSKLLTDKKSVAIKIIWNAIVQNMALNHIISRDQATELMYTKKYDPLLETDTIVEPIFFTAEEDGARALPNKDAQRRVSFFAQSLSQPIPEPVRTDQMPGFTVLIPHYGEKIVLSLKETIKHNNTHSKVTILEYLQKLYPTEWQHFVEESKRFARIVSVPSFDTFTQQNDMLVNILGFSSSKPKDTNKTRLWCSARTQTLYKTVSGFMNYLTAIKLLHYSETNQFHTPDLKVMSSVDELTSRKFRMIVAMQKYTNFNEMQLQDTELLFELFPDLKIVFVDKEVVDGKTKYYSSMIDSTCEVIKFRRRPKYRIKISGNPILGDGKSDNQNHALIYYRGEYLQLIDSNQDHYLEECLKIRNALSEFEEIRIKNPYSSDPQGKVAIVGAREYIFSENVGVLGDVAAGKEQTFGTLFARTLAKVGGKLHYGHPDFLNAIFMTTRGGVSKAQKGLHLNEDIYAGMTALCRGGRIKHTEYIQCGKGRDLGFVSILNFTTKIGAGMGEQLLSREYFWLGTKLPFDRFMSFYYAHPGFHLNNVCILASIDLFLTILTWIAVVNNTTKECNITPGQLKTQLRLPPGCVTIEPLRDWLTRCVGSIAMVFLITQLPLFIQELSEKGLTKSLLRIAKHFFSFSMLFEIFVCQIYASGFTEDLAVGGAKYISTGREFATTRVSFHILYEGYSTQSIYFAMRSILVLIYVSAVFWHPTLIWFWLTAFALSLSPTLFNPHQFNVIEFFFDYKRTLQWFSDGGWVSFVRQRRSKVTGYHCRESGHPLKPSIWKLLTSELIFPAVSTIFQCVPYIYTGSQRLARFQQVPTSNPILQLLVLSGMSFASNFAAAIIGLLLSPGVFFCKDRIKATQVTSTATYSLALIFHIAIYWLVFMLNKRNFPQTILGIISIGFIERLLVKACSLMLCRQLPASKSNDAWWSAHWGVLKEGYQYWLTPLDELICKAIECSLYSFDFLVIHFLVAVQLPIVLIPKVDDLHSIFLLWLSPSQPLTIPSRLAKQHKHSAIKYGVLCVVLVIVLGVVLAVPALFPTSLVFKVRGLKIFN